MSEEHIEITFTVALPGREPAAMTTTRPLPPGWSRLNAGERRHWLSFAGDYEVTRRVTATARLVTSPASAPPVPAPAAGRS